MHLVALTWASALAARGGERRARGEGEVAVWVEARLALRALVPATSAGAAAVALRMAERAQMLAQYAPHWSVRPKARARSWTEVHRVVGFGFQRHST